MKITVTTRQEFDAKLSTVQETIASYAAITFAKLGLHKTDDKGALKEQEQQKTKTYKAALSFLPKDRVLISPKLKETKQRLRLAPAHVPREGSEPGHLGDRPSAEQQAHAIPNDDRERSAVMVERLTMLLGQRLAVACAGARRPARRPSMIRMTLQIDEELRAERGGGRSLATPPPRQLVVELHQPPRDRPGPPVADGASSTRVTGRTAARGAGDERLVGAAQLVGRDARLASGIPLPRARAPAPCARVMPSRMPTSSGGVRTSPPTTTNTLLLAPSATLPSAAHRIAS